MGQHWIMSGWIWHIKNKRESSSVWRPSKVRNGAYTNNNNHNKNKSCNIVHLKNRSIESDFEGYERAHNLSSTIRICHAADGVAATRALLIEWVQDEIFKLTDKTVQSHYRLLLHTHYSRKSGERNRCGGEKIHGHVAIWQTTASRRTARTKSHSTAHIVWPIKIYLYTCLLAKTSQISQ